MTWALSSHATGNIRRRNKKMLLSAKAITLVDFSVELQREQNTRENTATFTAVSSYCKANICKLNTKHNTEHRLDTVNLNMVNSKFHFKLFSKSLQLSYLFNFKMYG